MAPANKSKLAGVSASSFFDLKAELAKHEEEFTKNKAAGKGAAALIGGVKRPDKKPTVWTRQNKGVTSRASRDIELEAVSRPTLESARAALEHKAKIYDKLRKGKSGGLNDQQYDALLVDFDLKPMDGHYESDSDDVDESLTVPKASQGEEDDPIVEYEDEFGRIRTGRRSEIPRNLLPTENEAEIDEDIVIHNPTHHFPTYTPSAERVAAIEEAHSEAANPLAAHYDAAAEVRARGAGFYQFAVGDEAARAAQMEELRAAREETTRAREEVGAMDVKPGEVPGEGQGRSRAIEKRRREVEERRKLVEAKRRKVLGASASATTDVGASTGADLSTGAGVSGGADTEVAAIGSANTKENGVSTATASAVEADPFATLEAQSSTQKENAKRKRKGKGKGKGKDKAANEADAFLAQLEQEIHGGQ